MTMTNTIKSLVSKNKRRHIEDGFNLDLTYISDRVIAMGYPSEKVESIYRNNLEDVQRFLEKKHKDHYKIYNLCSERSYDIQKFHSRVAIFPFDDHNPPEFGQMQPFCLDVDKWLDEHDKNVAVVHCKAGKGRTGLMICAYLLHRRYHVTAHDVLAYYASVRTIDQKGVTIPSQRRYVDYYAAMVREKLQYTPVKMYLTSIVIDPLPQLALGHHDGYIQFEIRQTSVRPFVSEVYQVKKTDGRINIELQNPLLIVGDVKIDFTHKMKFDFLNISKGTGGFSKVPNGKLFHFWVNTFFIDQQRSTVLTHDSTLSTSGWRLGGSTPTTSRPSTDLESSGESADVGDRNCRSNHNSGGCLVENSPLPPPRQLRPTLSVGDQTKHEPINRSQEDDQQSEENSPNGSCLGSVQTIHSHPPARTLSIVGQQNNNNGVTATDQATAELKGMSISGDYLAEQAMRGRNEVEEQRAVIDTTHKSFIEKRMRHQSVPQTARAGQVAGGVQGPDRPRRYIPPGRQMSIRLNKSQIDKASKDKSGKFSDNFNVTLFLVRPNDQTLQAEFSRSNLYCQHSQRSTERQRFVITGLKCSPLSDDSGVPTNKLGVQPLAGDERDGCPPENPRIGGTCDMLDHQTLDSSEDSSEEEAELRIDRRRGPELTVQLGERVARTLTAPIHGMVRNQTEPLSGVGHRLSDMGLSQSTWI